MRWYRIALLSPAALALALTVGPTRAEDKQADPPAGEAPGQLEGGQVPDPADAAGIADVVLAQDLIEYGRANATPEALITAALILHRTPVDPVKDAPADAAPLPEPKALLAEARKMRADDKALGEVIAQAEEKLNVKERDAVGGVKRFSGNKATTVGIAFAPNKPALVHATGKNTITVKIPGLAGAKAKEIKRTLPAPIRLTVVDGSGKPVYNQVGASVQWVGRPAGKAAATYKVTVTPVVAGSTFEAHTN